MRQVWELLQMNKRIKKKRARLSPLKIGEHVYSHEYIRDINEEVYTNGNER